MATLVEKLSHLAQTKQEIKNAIIDKGIVISPEDTYRSYADKIRQIPSGDVYIEGAKYGISANTILGAVEDGVLTSSASYFTDMHFDDFHTVGENVLKEKFKANANIRTFNSGSVGEIQDNGMRQTFYQCPNIIQVKLDNLAIVGAYGLYNTFYQCEQLEDIRFDRLERIETFGLYNVCYYCNNLRSPVFMPNLHYVAQNGLSGAFRGCISIETAFFPRLQTIEQSGLTSCFNGCTKLSKIALPALESAGQLALGSSFSKTGITTISFPSLVSITNNSFSASTFQGCTALTEIHFRKDMQESFEEIWSANTYYSNKFGATNATVYFDLIGAITVNDVVYTRSEMDSACTNEATDFVAWRDENYTLIYTHASSEPEIGTQVYFDAGMTIAGTVSAVA